MVKYFFSIMVFSIILLSSCSKQNKVNEINTHENNTKGKYVLSLRDSINFEDMITGGTASILYANDQVIDTINALFNKELLKDSVILYQTIELLQDNDGYDLSPNTRHGTLGKYYLWRNGHKYLAHSFLALFDDWFSSPNLIDSKVYYWGLSKSSNQEKISVFAMRYDIITSKIDSLFLFQDALETDNPGYFYFPQKTNNQFKFQSEWRGWFVDNSFKVSHEVKQ